MPEWARADKVGRDCRDQAVGVTKGVGRADSPRLGDGRLKVIDSCIVIGEIESDWDAKGDKNEERGTP